ncbi:MAG: class I SAM-dependent methyltransferase [SAR202 cluster bacterium]|nr:class I SAM-dependent methyltransferase [SAR202 cluster bacterium]
MWYWVRKIEGLALIPLIPLILWYFRRKNITHTVRCRRCEASLLMDARRFSEGWCERCFDEMLYDDPVGFHQLLYSEINQNAVQPELKPAFDWFFDSLVKRVKTGNVLDVGCETGYVLSRLEIPEDNKYGLDVVAASLKVAKASINEGNFSLGDAANIPYKSDSFDYVICTEVLEHLENPAAAIEECFRVLKPDGTAFFTVPNGAGVAGRYLCSHIQFFTYGDILTLVEGSGFKVVEGEKHGLYVPFVTYTLAFISGILKRQLPFSRALLGVKVPEPLSMTFVLECRKFDGND